MEPAFQIVPREDEVTQEVATIEDQAKALQVVDAESYIAAGELWKSIKALRKKVADTFDDIISAAHLAHKKAVEKKKMHDNPLDAAERIVKTAMSNYDLAQERIRKAEEDRLREIERKAEEERRLQEAIALEAQGEKEVAEAVMEAPVYVAPVVIPKTTPKLQGGPVFQTRWDFEVIDANIIPRQYMVPDLVKIRQLVTALKGQANIPGIRAFEKRV